MNILVLHIVTALAGLAVTTYTYVTPTQARLKASYTLAALTLVSGIYLTIQAPSHLPQACLTGLAYFGLVGYGIAAARTKLAHVSIES